MNIATNTLKKLVAQWVRGWLPFTVVTKGGWLGFSVIQDAVDYCGTRGGGLVFIGPGTFREAQRAVAQRVANSWQNTQFERDTPNTGAQQDG